MAIEKMKAVTIAGPVGEFERIVSKYIYGQSLHLENAMSALNYRPELHTFDETDYYDPIVKGVADIMKQAGMDIEAAEEGEEFSLKEINDFLDNIRREISEDKDRMEAIRMQHEETQRLLTDLKHLTSLHVDLSRLFDFRFIRFRYGHISQSSYKTLNTFLNDLPVIFVKTDENPRDVWGFYFTPESSAAKVEEVFNSLYFEEIEIPPAFRGIPADTQNQLNEREQKLQKEKLEIEKRTREVVSVHSQKLNRIYALAKRRRLFSEIRKNAVHSSEFFYIVGWMSRRDAARLEKRLNAEGDIVLFVTTDPDELADVQPPTKLRNNPIFKPFEFFVKMYGLPSYNEIDPTPVLAITYILFFGIMFGDVGQSAIFAILGFLLYRLKKIPLVGIIGMVGLSGVAFGFVYGDVFGYEVLPHLIAPMHSINQMLGITIGLGVFFIIVGLSLNIINGFKAGRVGQALFGHNGVAGLVFYLTIIVNVVGIFLADFSVPTWLTAVLITVSVLCMYLNEPLSALAAGEKKWLPTEGMFYVENLFEMFEVVLSYFTNTISFLRIGAFAIVHIGMMMVVQVLAQGGGVGGIIVSVIGNILVMGLEGLIVGIQVLRLEYYEMFSRYFSGQGKEFVSISENK